MKAIAVFYTDCEGKRRLPSFHNDDEEALGFVNCHFTDSDIDSIQPVHILTSEQRDAMLREMVEITSAYKYPPRELKTYQDECLRIFKKRHNETERGE